MLFKTILYETLDSLKSPALIRRAGSARSVIT